jgi:hypothetical protein
MINRGLIRMPLREALTITKASSESIIGIAMMMTRRVGIKA